MSTPTPLPDMPRDPTRTRGRYAFTLDGVPAGIDERFVLGDLAQGVVRVRTTRVLSRPTSRVESDVRIGPEGLDVEVRWTGSGPGVVREGSVQLVERHGTVSGRRVVDGQAYDVSAVDARLNTVAHAVSGPLVLAAVTGLDLVAPDLTSTGDPAALLAPVSERWRTVATGTDATVVAGEAHEGTAYGWVDEVSGRTATMLVDEGGLLLRTRLAAADGLLEVRLVELTGPWPQPTTWWR